MDADEHHAAVDGWIDRWREGAFSSHWFPYDRVGVVNADP
jgi:hypothetical protein